MKKILLFLALIMALPIGVTAQKKSIKKFYRQYKKGKEVRNFVIPGFLIRLGTGLARDVVKTDEEYEMLKLARKIRQARILFTEEENLIDDQDYQQLIHNVRQTAYEDLIDIRTEDTKMQIMIDEDGTKIKGLFIVVHAEDTFMMLHMKTKLKYEDINRAIQLFKDELPLKKEEPKEKKPVPQV